MNKFATKEDMMTDTTAFYKTEKAFTEYRNKIVAFDQLFKNDEPKAWQIVHTAVGKVVGKTSYIMYVFVVVWLLVLFLVIRNMQGVQDGITAYQQMSEFAKHTTGRFGRVWQILEYFRWQEYAVIAVSIIPMVIFSTQYGKWNMKKVVAEIKSLI